MRKYIIESYGCQMNVAESAAIELQLKNYGWEEAAKVQETDIVIINTCSVRKTAENRIWGRLGYYKQYKKDCDFNLIVVGCMAERLKNEIQKKFPVVDAVISNFKKKDITEYLEKDFHHINDITATEVRNSKYIFFNNHGGQSSTHSMIPIMNGCNNFCSYCIVPYVRGREISRKTEDILYEIKADEKEGISEITLIGQNVNSYTYGENNFSQLLLRILEETNIKWLRFTSSNPQDFTDQLIDVINLNKRICSFIHLPAQHGSNRVLKRMNRKYTSETYLEIASKLKSLDRHISLSTDLMVGFPGETEEDYLKLLKLVEAVRFEEAFTYYYNPREGTAAWNFENDVPHKIKLDRLENLIKIQRKIAMEEKEKRLGEIVEAVVEGESKKDSNKMLARTERNSMVVFPKKNIKAGNYVKIKLNELVGNTFSGEALNV